MAHDCPDRMFELCIPVVASYFVLVAIIVGGILVFFAFYYACGVKNRRLERERQARLADVELRLRATSEQVSRDAAVASVDVAEAGVVTRDFAAPTPADEERQEVQAETEAEASRSKTRDLNTRHPKAGDLVRDAPGDVDAITPAEPREAANAHVNPLRQHPIE